MDAWISKVVYTYSGMLLSLKKEGSSAMRYNMDALEHILLSKVSYSQKDIYRISVPV